MRLDRTQLKSIVQGSTILGTGGGGRYDSALKALVSVPAVELCTLEKIPDNGIVITAYGAGGLTKPAVTSKVLWRGLKLLQQRLGKPISAIVPVEIGPLSLVDAFQVAAKLQVPVLDADLVGYRSVPEIFIELVTLANLPRCPLVFGNNEGDLVLLENDSSPERLEQLIRSFADRSNSNTFVLGYPLTKRQLQKCAAAGSVSYCLQVRDALSSDFTLVGGGTVMADNKEEVGGFTQGELRIRQGQDVLRAKYKNEYLVLIKNEEVVVTCPDLICIVDQATGLGLNNGDKNVGKKVAVYVRPAIKAWQTAQARKLFSPRALGLDYAQKVLP